MVMDVILVSTLCKYEFEKISFICSRLDNGATMYPLYLTNSLI